MASYQLWHPWTSLDESLQWIRQATPRPYSRYSLPARAVSVNSRKFRTGQRCAAAYKAEYKGIIAPQPLLLQGLDVVFGNFITAQPPMGCSTLCVSNNSAFSRVISKEEAAASSIRIQEDGRDEGHPHV